MRSRFKEIINGQAVGIPRNLAFGLVSLTINSLSTGQGFLLELEKEVEPMEILYAELAVIHLEQNPMAKVNPIEVQKHLKGIDYPVNKENLIKHAEQNGADEELRSRLEELPEDEYETPTDVNKAIGQIE